MKNIKAKNSIVLVLVLFFCASSLTKASENSVYKDYFVRAAFLYNFAKFVEWPPCTQNNCNDDNLVIGIYDSGELGDTEWSALNSIQGKTVRQKVVLVKQILKPSDLLGCQLVYILSSQSIKVEPLLDLLKGRPILTVSDRGKFINFGGIIELMEVGSKLRFAINRKAASDASIEISAQLLKLAQFVVE